MVLLPACVRGRVCVCVCVCGVRCVRVSVHSPSVIIRLAIRVRDKDTRKACPFDEIFQNCYCVFPSVQLQHHSFISIGFPRSLCLLSLSRSLHLSLCHTNPRAHIHTVWPCKKIRRERCGAVRFSHSLCQHFICVYFFRNLLAQNP